MRTNNVSHVRDELARLLASGQRVGVAREGSMTSLVGSSTVEIVGASFIADDEAIFGAVDHGYLEREEAWYRSMSLNVNDIPGGAPKIWQAIAASDGTVNSNYGWCLRSPENCCQLQHVIEELRRHPDSRRAVAIYTRPSMWYDYKVDGRADFMCTNAVQYLIREGALHACVQMRSNDAVTGYKNDRAWQRTVLAQLAGELNLPMGTLHWAAGSLHVYARHFYLVDHYARTGEVSITRSRYREAYPGSPYGKDPS